MIFTNKKVLILILTLILFNGIIYGCDISYEISDINGVVIKVSPDKNILLSINSEYTLFLHYKQDHGRCNVEYSDTVFLLEEEKWKTSKEYLPLVLTEDIIWNKNSSRGYIATIKFKANELGIFELEVIRECDTKEGYDESLKFEVN